MWAHEDKGRMNIFATFVSADNFPAGALTEMAKQIGWEQVWHHLRECQNCNAQRASSSSFLRVRIYGSHHGKTPHFEKTHVWKVIYLIDGDEQPLRETPNERWIDLAKEKYTGQVSGSIRGKTASKRRVQASS